MNSIALRKVGVQLIIQIQQGNSSNIKYDLACKANGSGYMNMEKFPGAMRLNDSHSAQAIYSDIKALKWSCEHIEKSLYSYLEKRTF